jgi:hypothetical protein
MTDNRIGRQLSLATRRELIQAIAKRYHAAARRDKKKILDEFVEVTGFHRKHAIRALRKAAADEASKPRHLRSRIYDEAVIQALTILWEAADRICGKRLKRAIPSLLDAMERHGHLQAPEDVRRLILAASAATIDRALAPIKNVGKQGRRRTSINTPLRKSITVRTFADWNDPPPGFFEMDMVAHCGKSVAGSHVHSLVLTDIASGWTVAGAMMVREQTLVVVTVEVIRGKLPFPLLGLDVDNDSAFINDTLVNYCKGQSIKLTRSRAYKKNDQAWIEQKNGSVVRRMVGYGRLEGIQSVAAVAELHEAARLYVNFFLPSFKLQSKTRVGAKVFKKYDKPTTPYERLLVETRMTEEQKEQLRSTFADLDPIVLLRRIREAQSKIARLEVSAGCFESAKTDPNPDHFVQNLGIAWKDGEVRATHRKPASGPRIWRTRVDPFESTWPTVERWLSERPDATGKELFQRLQSSASEPFQPGQLRTLQRRVKEWRTAIARSLLLDANLQPAKEAIDQPNEKKETVFD